MHFETLEECVSICICMHIRSVCMYAHQFSRSILSDSSLPVECSNARLPCPSPTPGACSNSCPSSQWCHPTIPSSVMICNRGVVKIELLFPEHSWLWGLHSPLVSCVCLESSQLSVLLRDCEITKEDWTLQKEISLWIVINLHIDKYANICWQNWQICYLS